MTTQQTLQTNGMQDMTLSKEVETFLNTVQYEHGTRCALRECVWKTDKKVLQITCNTVCKRFYINIRQNTHNINFRNIQQ